MSEGMAGQSIPLAEPIQRVLAAGALALLVVTWHLWTPQNVFPCVPAFEFVANWPHQAISVGNWIALGLAAAALAYLAIGKIGRIAKAAAIGITAAFLMLVVLDQHRLQPWVVHVVVGLLLLEFARWDRRIDYLRWFTASIYIYSALGKFDAQFLHTVGQDFIGTLLGQLGWDIRLFSEPARFWLAAGLPIAELVVGCGLAIGRTQGVAAAAAIVMHLLLLAVLGPWGLRHAWGVLIWNMLFIALDALLFLWPRAATSANNLESTAPVRFGWVEALLVVAMVGPLGERVGLVDHWMGWALYAPHSSRVRIEVAAAAVPDLPAVVKPYIDGADELELIWREIRIDRWSLGALGAPVYPQQRFQLGVARAVAERVGPREIRVHLLSTADRWTGRRVERTLDGRAALESAAEEYWLSTKPIFAPTPR